MGSIKKCMCATCGYSCELKTGHGITHSTVESVLPVFNEEIQRHIRTAVKGQEFPYFSFNYRIMICNSCKSFVSVPEIELENETIIGDCPVCGSCEGLSDVLDCPRCGDKTVVTNNIGRWD